MVENIKGIQNPLTIIAIFAGLAEVAGTVALATVDKSLQGTFVWFVMGFPTVLVALFFLTLNFNPKVLYAPSDFRSDDTFLNMLAGERVMAEGFRGLTKQLEVARQQIVDEAIKQVGQAGEAERTRLANIVGEQIERVQEKVETIRESAIETALATAPTRDVVLCEFCKLYQLREPDSRCRRCGALLGTATDSAAVYPRSALQADILNLLLSNARPMSMTEIATGLGQTRTAALRALQKLSDRGAVVARNDFRGPTLFQHAELAVNKPGSATGPSETEPAAKT